MFAVLLAAAWPVFDVGALAAEPPSAPRFAREAGTHLNLVRAVAVDAAGAFLVTASDDKTARVWSLPDGRAGPVLRVPVGDGDEGYLRAVALTPDARWVAVAGRSGATWLGTQQVYVFDRASGDLVRRIDTGAAQAVTALEISPNGRWLAVGLAGAGGLRLFDFASGTLLFQDRRFEGAIYGLDFRPDGGALVAGARDGDLRLYAVQSGTLLLAQRLPALGGRAITQARYAPDGQLLAIGFDNAAQALVLDGRSLAVVAELAAGDRNGAFSSLAWSADGRELWAGGSHRDGDQHLLRAWTRGAWTQFVDRSVGRSPVMVLQRLPGQRVLFASSDPAWGFIDASATPRFLASAAAGNFNGMARHLGLSRDATVVRFRYQPGGPLFDLDLAQRAIRPASASASEDWVAPRTEAPGMRLESWESARGPRLNGLRLPLSDVDTARALDIAPSGSSFALGSDERLWMFDSTGAVRWSTATGGGIVWAVRHSADGRIVAAALNDGTLRWYRAADGAELLAAWPHTDRRRWVAWTPAGYYDAATGADDLLGMHVNRGDVTRPDFHPIWTLRQRLYRADVIDRVLQAADEGQALRLANAASGRAAEAAGSLLDALPPMLELAGDPTVRLTERTALLKVRVRSRPNANANANANANDVSFIARADGRPAVVEAVAGDPSSGAGGERLLRVRFSGQPARLQLTGQNRHGSGAALDVPVVWLATPPPEPTVDREAASTRGAVAIASSTASAAPRIQPRLYLLSIGVGRFKSADIAPLSFAAKDARDFVQSLQGQVGTNKLYRSIEAKLLVDEAATRDSIEDGLQWLQRNMTQHDVGMLFLAGHGLMDTTLGYFFLPHNAEKDSPGRTAVSGENISRTLKSAVGKAVFFVDTCHSGGVLGTTRAALPDDASPFLNELVRAESGVVVFSASTGKQLAHEDPRWGNGAFTKALVEGLGGKADTQGTGRVTHTMLNVYVSERVKELTEGRQSPVTQALHGVPDFPLSTSR